MISDLVTQPRKLVPALCVLDAHTTGKSILWLWWVRIPQGDFHPRSPDPVARPTLDLASTSSLAERLSLEAESLIDLS